VYFLKVPVKAIAGRRRAAAQRPILGMSWEDDDGPPGSPGGP
jgi:hypothetical protein